MTLLLVFGSIVVFVAVLVGFGIAAGRLTGWLVRRMVERRHRELQDLVEHGWIPHDWIPGWQGGPEQLDARRRRRCQRRLDALAAEVERSTLVADEETRRELLARLTVVRARLDGLPG